MMEIYGCFIVGLSLGEIQTICEEKDKRFANNRQTQRKATKFERDTEYSILNKTSTEMDKSKSFAFPLMPDDDE